MLNTWKALANSPEILTSYLPFLRAVAGAGQLDQRTKELAAVQVALENHCLYTASHRCASAQRQGISSAELEALASGDLSPFAPHERLAVGIAQSMSRSPTLLKFDEAPQLVNQDVLRSAQETFSPAALLELILGIAVWNGLARFHRAMGLELDMPAPPAAVLAVL